MESDIDGVHKNASFNDTNKPRPDPETEVEELLRQAGLEEENSDTEFISAEEDNGSNFNEGQSFIRREEKDTLNEAFPQTDENSKICDDVTCDKDKTAQGTDKDDELAIRQKEEDLLSLEEKEERRDRGQSLKSDGNNKFQEKKYEEAIKAYTEALDLCPLNFRKERAIMFANRAACKMKKEEYSEAIDDSSSAIDLHPQYIKAMLRRAELYERTEKLDEALKDYEKIVELDPSHHPAKAAGIRLAEQIRERNEKMKEEMIGKLKDLGNLVLRPFGLNTNNFNLQQDPNTGSYSVQFRQNPTGNGL